MIGKYFLYLNVLHQVSILSFLFYLMPLHAMLESQMFFKNTNEHNFFPYLITKENICIIPPIECCKVQCVFKHFQNFS